LPRNSCGQSYRTLHQQHNFGSECNRLVKLLSQPTQQK
jgi:hypothetical protein